MGSGRGDGRGELHCRHALAVFLEEHLFNVGYAQMLEMALERDGGGREGRTGRDGGRGPGERTEGEDGGRCGGVGRDGQREGGRKGRVALPARIGSVF